MEPRISLITLGVRDLQRSLRFYRDGLGFPHHPDRGQRHHLLPDGRHLPRALPVRPTAKDVSDQFLVERSKFPGITIAHNVRRREEVDQLLKQAEAAGARIEKPAQDAEWGGYSGYFSDPDGYLWEVAWGAFEFREDGSLIIP